MSLTSILKREKGRINLKDWFRFHFPNPKLNVKKDILVKPYPSLGNYSGEIGTAFDYLFRFNLERINKIKLQENKCWVAESGYEELIKKIEANKDKNITIGYNRDKQVNKLKFKKFIIKEFEDAKTNYNNFIKNGVLTHNLIKSSIILAKLDLIIRIGKIDANFDSIEKERILELEELFNIVTWKFFKTTEFCLLNPTFEKGSGIVGGADADVVIGNTLIDIKTNRDFKLERQDLNQVIGYCLLAILGKLDIQIKNIGIYYARYGYLWQIPLTDFYELEYLQVLAEEFKQLIEDKNLNLIPQENYKESTKLHLINGYKIDEDDFKCPRCESKNFIKNGTKGEKFRYKCKNCSIGFTSKIKASSIKEKSKILSNLDKLLKILSEEYSMGLVTLKEYKTEKAELTAFAKKLSK